MDGVTGGVVGGTLARGISGVCWLAAGLVGSWPWPLLWMPVFRQILVRLWSMDLHQQVVHRWVQTRGGWCWWAWRPWLGEASSKAGANLMLDVPAEGHQLCVEPIGCMWSHTIWISPGVPVVMLADAKRSLVCPADDLAWDPNPFGDSFFQHLQELWVPPGCASCARFP